MTSPSLPNLSGAQTDAELIQIWLQGKAPGTVRLYRHCVHTWMTWHGRTLQEVTVVDVQGWIASLAHLAPGTRNLRLSVIKSLLAYAARTGYLPWNVGVVVLKETDPQRHTTRILTPTQVAQLIQAATSPRNRTLLLYLYLTGARISEALAVTYEDIADLHEAARPTIVTIVDKGQRVRHVALPEPLRPSARSVGTPVYSSIRVRAKPSPWPRPTAFSKRPPGMRAFPTMPASAAIGCGTVWPPMPWTGRPQWV